MSLWAPVLGALAASLLGWLAIAAFVAAGEQRLRMGPIRGFGAAALVAVGLSVAGLPVPWLVAPGLLVVGLSVAAFPTSARAG